MTDDERFERAIAAIDAANAEDPTTVEVRGKVGPKEILHAELMTTWVRRLRPDAGEALLLAARAHHLRRWLVPRTEFKPGRAGYLAWRRHLHERHAEDAAAILAGAGYDETTIDRVRRLVAKRDQPARGVASDLDVQALEDALCLVFLETQLADLAARLDAETLSRVIAKTLAKMSPAGIATARQLPLGDQERALLEQVAARG